MRAVLATVAVAVLAGCGGGHKQSAESPTTTVELSTGSGGAERLTCRDVTRTTTAQRAACANAEETSAGR
jgi:hypothetical protein